MKTFDVLSRSQKIHRRYLLEASAGTGKTFSIENIFVRLLIETQPSGTDPLSIDQILVVTFTRAATRDLKARIRANIEKAIDFLSSQHACLEVPDYLLEHLEAGEKRSKASQHLLENALARFDEAQIFTIHGFCARILRDYVFESDLSIGVTDKEQFSIDQQMRRIIRDFFLIGWPEDEISKAQLEILLNEYSQSSEKIAEAIKKILETGLQIERQDSYLDLFKSFKSSFQSIIQEQKIPSKAVLEDFLMQAPFYKKLCDRSKKIKPEPFKIINRFAEICAKSSFELIDFEQLIKDGLFYVDALHPDNLNSKIPDISKLQYPQLFNELKEKLFPILSRARAPHVILLKMAFLCQKMLSHWIEEEEQFGYDGILKAACEPLNNAKFVEEIRKTYPAVIVDEFQDTDPLQWKIFDSLFLSNHSSTYLYLVGDPKQSIYAFRQADIYTYLNAAQDIGKEQHASLNTNYRSTPKLINALNALFSPAHIPNMIFLPKWNLALEYLEVNSSHKPQWNINDQIGSVHFCLSSHEDTLSLEQHENEKLFPYVASEIIRLHQNENIAFKAWAILVSDRFQAKRLAAFFNAKNIPYTLHRPDNLKESAALKALQELLYALIVPNESTLKTVLGGRIFQWSFQDLLTFEDNDIHEKVWEHFDVLRKTLFQKGFYECYHALLNSSISHAETVIEHLLSIKNGLSFYEELEQLVEILIEHEQSTSATPSELLEFLDRFQQLEKDSDALKRRIDPTRDAINILTIHSSKGLEFDIVVALGLAVRSKCPDLFIPKEHTLSAAIDEDSEDYLKYCEELDAEKMRQLYVAMTRAKYRLYLPVIINKKEKPLKLGSASPMELFLGRFNQTCTEPLYESISKYDGQPLFQFIEKYGRSKDITGNEINHIVLNSLPPFQSCVSLAKPNAITVPYQYFWLHSFTTLAKTSSDYIENAPHDFNADDKSVYTLPAGSEVGLLLHTIFQYIPFEEVAKAENYLEIIPLIHEYTQHTVFEKWESVIAQIVFRTLTNVLQLPNGSLRLADLSRDARYHELEFLYPVVTEINLEGLQNIPGYLKGVIDLIFMFEGKYFIIDWKSNWLGPSSDDYSDEKMHLAMQHHDYFLQAEIYTEALKRFLQTIDSRPFADIFGGAYYLFVRGCENCSMQYKG